MKEKRIWFLILIFLLLGSFVFSETNSYKAIVKEIPEIESLVKAHTEDEKLPDFVSRAYIFFQSLMQDSEIQVFKLFLQKQNIPLDLMINLGKERLLEISQFFSEEFNGLSKEFQENRTAVLEIYLKLKEEKTFPLIAEDPVSLEGFGNLFWGNSIKIVQEKIEYLEEKQCTDTQFLDMEFHLLNAAKNSGRKNEIKELLDALDDPNTIIHELTLSKDGFENPDGVFYFPTVLSQICLFEEKQGLFEVSLTVNDLPAFENAIQKQYGSPFLEETFEDAENRFAVRIRRGGDNTLILTGTQTLLATLKETHFIIYKKKPAHFNMPVKYEEEYEEEEEEEEEKQEQEEESLIEEPTAASEGYAKLTWGASPYEVQEKYPTRFERSVRTSDEDYLYDEAESSSDHDTLTQKFLEKYGRELYQETFWQWFPEEYLPIKERYFHFFNGSLAKVSVKFKSSQKSDEILESLKKKYGKEKTSGEIDSSDGQIKYAAFETRESLIIYYSFLEEKSATLIYKSKAIEKAAKAEFEKKRKEKAEEMEF